MNTSKIFRIKKFILIDKMAMFFIYSTNFLVENKFHQTILHVVLKAGYYNKLVVYGDESAAANIQTIRTLFSTNNLTVQSQMRSIINRLKTISKVDLPKCCSQYTKLPL